MAGRMGCKDFVTLRPACLISPMAIVTSFFRANLVYITIAGDNTRRQSNEKREPPIIRGVMKMLIPVGFATLYSMLLFSPYYRINLFYFMLK